MTEHIKKNSKEILCLLPDELRDYRGTILSEESTENNYNYWWHSAQSGVKYFTPILARGQDFYESQIRVPSKKVS